MCYSLADKSVSSIEQWTHALSQTAEGWVYVCVYERESEWWERERERECGLGVRGWQRGLAWEIVQVTSKFGYVNTRAAA